MRANSTFRRTRSTSAFAAPSTRAGGRPAGEAADATPRARQFGWLYALVLALLCGEWLLRRFQAEQLRLVAKLADWVTAQAVAELGLAHAIGKPAILVSTTEDDIPF